MRTTIAKSLKTKKQTLVQDILANPATFLSLPVAADLREDCTGILDENACLFQRVVSLQRALGKSRAEVQEIKAQELHSDVQNDELVADLHGVVASMTGASVETTQKLDAIAGDVARFAAELGAIQHLGAPGRPFTVWWKQPQLRVPPQPR